MAGIVHKVQYGYIIMVLVLYLYIAGGRIRRGSWCSEMGFFRVRAIPSFHFPVLWTLELPFVTYRTYNTHCHCFLVIFPPTLDSLTQPAPGLPFGAEVSS